MIGAVLPATTARRDGGRGGLVTAVAMRSGTPASKEVPR
jgi:hypothetical protein